MLLEITFFLCYKFIGWVSGKLYFYQKIISAGGSVSQMAKTSAKSTRQSRKSSWELELADLSHLSSTHNLRNPELSEKTRSIKNSRSVLMKNITVRQSDMVGNHSFGRFFWLIQI